MALAPGSVLYYKNDGTSETVSAASQFNFDNDCYIHSVLGVETIGFARDGYSFVSWNTASDGSGDSYNEGDTYTFSAKGATSSLYAIWEEVLPVPYLTTDTDLTAVADAIREKGGTSAELEWPSGYVDAIGDISGNAYTLTTVVPQQTFTPQELSGSYQTTVTYTAGLEDGEYYLVTYDGDEYVCECGVYWGTEYLAGYVDLFWGTRAESPYPFGIGYSPSVPEFSVGAYDTNPHTIKVEHLEFVDGPLNLIAKSVTENGTYSASSDNADGYSSVTVDVPSGGGTEKTITITLTNPRNASEAMNPACTIHEAEDPINPDAQIGQIETPTGSTTVTTSASCIVVEFHTYGALMYGSSLWEEGLTPLASGMSAGMGFYVFDSGGVTIDRVDYDD